MKSKPMRLAAIALIAAVVVTAAAVLSSSGAEPAPPPEALVVDGIPERGGVLGDPAAPVTVTEFVDLQCPVCAAAAREVLPQLLDRHVRPGKVKLELRTLSFLGPESVRAARVAAGAERQGRLWAFLEAFYARQGAENSGYVTDAFLREVAAAAGVDAEAALDAADGEFATDRLERADADAQALGVSGTPTFVVQREDAAPQVVDAGSLLKELGK
jgi:protein-disulfide isomerase